MALSLLSPSAFVFCMSVSRMLFSSKTLIFAKGLHLTFPRRHSSEEFDRIYLFYSIIHPKESMKKREKEVYFKTLSHTVREEKAGRAESPNKFTPPPALPSPVPHLTGGQWQPSWWHFWLDSEDSCIKGIQVCDFDCSGTLANCEDQDHDIPMSQASRQTQ